MSSSNLSLGIRHHLIQKLAKKQKRHPDSLSSQGFTLIELLVVVIIVGILASVALPGFLSQADKAKASSAKALVSSAVKECQVWLIEASGTFTGQVTGTPEITLAPAPITCSSTAANTYTATIVSNTNTFTATLAPTTGIVTKTCSGTIGCTAGKW